MYLLRKKDSYLISGNSFRRNYSFWNSTLCTVTFGYSTYRCGNYSREETIQGRKLFAEIRYLFLDNSREVLLTMLSLFPLNNTFVFFWTTSNFRLLHPLPLTTTITNSTWGKFLLKLLTMKNIR